MRIKVLKSVLKIDESGITESSAEIQKQVREYERGNRQTFELNVHRPNSVLGDVMGAMAEIPYGETRTYGTLAAELGTAPVAVGQACGRNPVPLIIPCHRVVGSDGGLKGYSGGDGIPTKRRLLEFEASNSGAGSVQSRLPTG